MGTPLAVSLLKEGYQIKGSTTSEAKLKSLQKLGIPAFLVQLTEEKIHGDLDHFLKDVTALVINIPPGLRNSANGSYIQRMELLLKAVKASKVEKVLFVSSISIYGDVSGIITENTAPKPRTESAKQLLAAEQMVQKSEKIDTTILRFGGLIGPNRHPVTFLSGKTGLTNGNDTVNLIHLKDCIAMISNIIKERYWNTVLNGVYPMHPTKKEYYTKVALQRGILPPGYLPSTYQKEEKIIKTAEFYVKNHSFQTSI